MRSRRPVATETFPALAAAESRTPWHLIIATGAHDKKTLRQNPFYNVKFCMAFNGSEKCAKPKHLTAKCELNRHCESNAKQLNNVTYIFFQVFYSTTRLLTAGAK